MLPTIILDCDDFRAFGSTHECCEECHLLQEGPAFEVWAARGLHYDVHLCCSAPATPPVKYDTIARMKQLMLWQRWQRDIRSCTHRGCCGSRWADEGRCEWRGGGFCKKHMASDVKCKACWDKDYEKGLRQLEEIKREKAAKT